MTRTSAARLLLVAIFYLLSLVHLEKSCGVGDSNANPIDPLSPDPAGDDELYDLRPFLEPGDTQLTIFTTNATNDDNIFLLALHTAIVPEAASAAPVCTVVVGARGSVLRPRRKLRS